MMAAGTPACCVVTATRARVRAVTVRPQDVAGYAEEPGDDLFPLLATADEGHAADRGLGAGGAREPGERLPAAVDLGLYGVPVPLHGRYRR